MFSSRFSGAILRNEAYLSYAAVTKDEAQRRYWTFYDAINFSKPVKIKRTTTNSARAYSRKWPAGTGYINMVQYM